MAESTRVPTSSPNHTGWSLETAIDYLLAVIREKDDHLHTLVLSNDRRYEERFVASQKALELGLAGTKSEISLALAAADRAVQKAEMATEKRFESVNEFRGTLDQQQRTLIPRTEVDVLVRGLDEKITQLTKQIDGMLSERAGIRGGWGYAVGVVGLMLAVGSLVTMMLRTIH
jgi:hypothetical protein